MNSIQTAYVVGRSPYIPLGGVDMQDIRCFHIRDASENILESIQKVVMHYDIFSCVVNEKTLALERNKESIKDAICCATEYVDTDDEIVKLANNYLEKYISIPFSIDRSLWRVVVVKLLSKKNTDTDCDNSLVIFSFNGIILDGYTISRVLREIFAVLSGKFQTFSLKNPDVVNEENISNQESGAIFENLKLLKSPIYLPWKRSPDKVFYSKRKRVSLPLSRSFLNLLSQKAGHSNIFENTIYLLAVCKGLCKQVKFPDFCIAIPTSRSFLNKECKNNSSFFPLPYISGFNEESLLQEAFTLQDLILSALDEDIDGVKVAQFLNTVFKNIIAMPVVFTNGLSWDNAEYDSRVRYIAGVTETPQVALDIRLFNVNSETVSLDLDYAEEVLEEETVYSIADSIRSCMERFVCVDFSLSLNESKKQEMDSLTDVDDLYFANSILRNLMNPSNSLALVSGRREVTYKQLAAEVMNAQRRLVAAGVARKEVVAICLPKCFEHVYYTIGCLLSGIIWLPLDADSPTDRIMFQLKNAKVGAIVFDTDNLRVREAVRNLSSDIKTIVLSCDLVKIEESASDGQLLSDFIDDFSDAYYLYTSGTTGNPKCVALNNIATNNVIYESIKRWNMSSADRVMSVTPFHHDMSLFDILATLSLGATLVIPEKEGAKDVIEWLLLLEKYQVSIWVSVPAIIDMLLMVANPSQLQSLKLVAQGGDYIKSNTIRKLMSVNSKLRLYSLGGPTETTIWSIWHEINLDSDLATYDCIPYGKALPKNDYFILDEKGNKCPKGCNGKITMSGLNISNGYIVDGEHHFDSYQNIEELGGKCHVSSDIGVISHDGTVLFKGREEGYLKVRGVRISAIEVEKYILDIPAISQCAVVEILLDSINSSELAVAYVSTENYSVLQQKVYVDYLRQYLPESHIPTKWYKVLEMPLTSNGKLDRKKIQSIITKMDFKDDKKNLSDNAKGKGFLLDDSDFELFVQLAENRVIQTEDENQGSESKYQIASEYEQRAWALHQQNPLSSAAPLTVVLKLNGQLNILRLIFCLYKLYSGNSAFNNSFGIHETLGVLVKNQKQYQPDEVIEVLWVKDSVEAENLLQHKFSQIIDIESGPIIKFYIYVASDGECFMGIHSHHILMDNNSWALILTYLSDLYCGSTRNIYGLSKKLVNRDNLLERELYWRKLFGTQLTAFKFSENLSFLSNCNPVKIKKVGGITDGKNNSSRYIVKVSLFELIEDVRDISLAKIIYFFGNFLLNKGTGNYIDILTPVIDVIPSNTLDNLQSSSNVLPIRVHSSNNDLNRNIGDVTLQIQNGIVHNLPYEKIINCTATQRDNLPNILITEFNNPAQYLKIEGVSVSSLDMPSFDAAYAVTLAYFIDQDKGLVQFELTGDSSINELVVGLLLQEFVSSLLEKRLQDINVPTTKKLNFVVNEKILKIIVDVYSEVLSLRVNKDDNFFMVGGHSLSATSVVGKLKTQYGINIRINDIFTHQTPAELAKHISTDINSDSPENELVPQSNEDTEVEEEVFQTLYPVTLLQKFYLEDAQFGKNKIFNIPFVFRLECEISDSKLKEIFEKILDRHSVLRSLIIHANRSEPQQKVLRMNELNSQNWFDICYEQDVLLAKNIAFDAGNRDFDLSREIPIKVRCVRNSKSECYLSVLIYHSAFDEWSAKIFIEEFIALLGIEYGEGSSSIFENCPVQYYEYSQEEFKERETILQGVDTFWGESLDAINSQHPLLQCINRSKDGLTQHATSSSLKIVFSSLTRNNLLKLAVESKTTLFQVIYGLLVLILYSLGAGNKILIGTSVACRDNPSYHSTIGLFTNVVLNQFSILKTIKLRDFFEYVKESIILSSNHARTPFPLVISKLMKEIKESPIEYYIQMHAGNPLNNITKSINGKEIRLELLEQQIVEPKFGLHFEIYDEPRDDDNALIFLIHYDSSKYSHTSLAPLIQSLEAFLGKDLRTISLDASVGDVLQIVNQDKDMQ